MMRFATLAAAALAATLAAPLAAQAPGEASAVIDPACQRECLRGHLRTHMEALRSKDASRLRLAADAVITENNVSLAPGQGLWRTVTAVVGVGAVKDAAPRAASVRTAFTAVRSCVKCTSLVLVAPAVSVGSVKMTVVARSMLLSADSAPENERTL